ncbi:MAG: DeoR/GlpR transcriptional regulator [Selenomonadaceae bacterium]|nr:DeoR/GlpR transcriptional regulator [Selenomonadaceae bacterium]
MRKRDTKILNVLGVRKKISVQELSELLQVTDVTIRKDLSVLEEKGLIKREHGFAVLPTSDDVSTRLLFNYETKRRIARNKAACSCMMSRSSHNFCFEEPRMTISSQ